MQHTCDITDRIRERVLVQLLLESKEISLVADITFPKAQGSKDQKMDI